MSPSMSSTKIPSQPSSGGDSPSFSREGSIKDNKKYLCKDKSTSDSNVILTTKKEEASAHSSLSTASSSSLQVSCLPSSITPSSNVKTADLTALVIAGKTSAEQKSDDAVNPPSSDLMKITLTKSLAQHDSLASRPEEASYQAVDSTVSLTKSNEEQSSNPRSLTGSKAINNAIANIVGPTSKKRSHVTMDQPNSTMKNQRPLTLEPHSQTLHNKSKTTHVYVNDDNTKTKTHESTTNHFPTSDHSTGKPTSISQMAGSLNVNQTSSREGIQIKKGYNEKGITHATMDRINIDLQEDEDDEDDEDEEEDVIAVKIPLAGPFVHGFLTGKKPVIECFEGDSESVVHEATSKILFAISRHGGTIESQDDRVTFPLSETEAVASDFIRERHSSIQQAIRMTFIETKDNHEKIMNQARKKIKTYVDQKLREKDETISEIKESVRLLMQQHKETLAKLQKNHEEEIKDLIKAHESEINALKEKMKDESRAHRGSLNAFVRATNLTFQRLKEESQSIYER